MADVLTSEQRQLNMSRIKGADTKPELLVRKQLFSEGFRYRLHCSELPGKPDIVLPKYRCVVFINGCFWHGHECELFKIPKTRTEFWVEKITKNKQRDTQALEKLQLSDWRICLVWECALKGKRKLQEDEITKMLSEFILSNREHLDISGV